MERNLVICPICLFEYNRVVSTKKIKSKDNYEAGWWGRGDLLVIEFSCENGCQWERCYGFHKGETYAFDRAYSGEWIYFIEAVGEDKIKIGISKNPEERLKQLNTGSASILRLIKKIPGTAKLENDLHKTFKSINHKNEWFFATHDLREYIETGIISD